MKALILLAACPALALAAPATAQGMDHSGHGRHDTAAPAAAPPPSSADASCPPEHAAMGHCTATAPVHPHGEGHAPRPAGDAAPHDHNQRHSNSHNPALPADPDCAQTGNHAAMGHCTPKAASSSSAEHGMTRPDASGTALPAGDARPPAPVAANYADRIWGRETMAPSRATLMREHGGMGYSRIMLDRAEVQLRNGRDGYHWSGEAWFGGDIHRLTIKSEGEGLFNGEAEHAEVQALYSRAIGPYFNLQAGIRHDIRPTPSRTYATIGLEGLAPYWFEVEGALFLSDKGDLLARLEGYHDQRITQRLILQPRAEMNLSAQTMRAEGIGGGLIDAELGLRLRYEIVREFAPYIGMSWERNFGDTARLARALGEGTGGFSFVAGIRAWF